MASLSNFCLASSFGNRNPSVIRPSISKPKLSCKASNEPADHDQHPDSLFDRRNVLLGLSGAAAGLSVINHNAHARPVPHPDLSHCGLAFANEGDKPNLECCPPFSDNIIDFTPPRYATGLRTRPAAHLAHPEYIAKYTKAVELMRALPDDDPRNFRQQANIHCAYCNGGYIQDAVNFPDLKLQVHNCWLFFPFHRLYLYFHERILGKLIGDDSFALPYWNWDHPDGMTIPDMFCNPYSSLYDPLRHTDHQPPTLLDLNFSIPPTPPPTNPPPPPSDAQRIDDNLKLMHRQMISNGKTPELFLGKPYRAGDPANPGGGSLENVPHAPLHSWTGDSRQINQENMGSFYSAGRDPLFYSHHCNVDRLWSVWKTLGGRNKNFNDRDWLETSFLFYDENRQLVRVKVKDCLDTEALGYNYQDMDLPWLKARPRPNVGTAARKHLLKSKAVRVGPKFPLVLKSPVNVTVRRPKVNRSEKEKEEVEEVLVIEDIEFDHNTFIKFDVLINSPDHAGVGSGSRELAGSFVNLPHSHNSNVKTQLTLGITDLIEDLEADDDKTLHVTLVPIVGKVTIGGVRIDFS